MTTENPTEAATLPEKKSKNPMEEVKDLLDAKRDSIQAVLPAHLTAERVIKIAVMACSRNPTLLQCTLPSLLVAVMQASELGLEISGSLGGAYLVPYQNKNLKPPKTHEAKMILGYRGMCELAYRTGKISKIEARHVSANDRFSLKETNAGTEMLHEPNLDGEGGDFRGVYCRVTMKDGTTIIDYMPKSDVEKIKKRSRASADGPWITDYVEMAKKTIVRRTSKMLPLSVEFREKIDTDDRADFGELLETMQNSADSAVDRLNSRVQRTTRVPGDVVEGTLVTDADAQQQPPGDGKQETTKEDVQTTKRTKKKDEPVQDGLPLGQTEPAKDAPKQETKEPVKEPTKEPAKEAPKEEKTAQAAEILYPAFYAKCEELAQSQNVPPESCARGIALALMIVGLKSKPHDTTQEWRLSHIEAIADGKFDWDSGKIKS